MNYRLLKTLQNSNIQGVLAIIELVVLFIPFVMFTATPKFLAINKAIIPIRITIIINPSNKGKVISAFLDLNDNNKPLKNALNIKTSLTFL